MSRGKLIWKGQNGSLKPMLLLSDFESAQTEIPPEYLTEKLDELADAFLDIENMLTQDEREEIRKALRGEEGAPEDTDEAEAWLSWMRERYFSAAVSRVSGGQRDAWKAFSAAAAWVSNNMSGEEEKTRAHALIRLTMLAWMVGRAPQELNPDAQEVRVMRHLDVLHVSWRVDDKQPLVRRMLINPMDRPIELVLRRDGKDGEQKDMLVCMAAHSRWLSLWAGERVTLLKSSITANDKYAYVQREDERLTLYPAGMREAKRQKTQEISDAAAGQGGNLYTISNCTFVPPGSDAKKENVLAVFGDGEIWAALRADGSLISRDADLRCSGDVIAVAETEEGLCPIQRGCTRMDWMDRMLAHLCDVTDEILPKVSEVVRCGKNRVALTADGRLIRMED